MWLFIVHVKCVIPLLYQYLYVILEVRMSQSVLDNFMPMTHMFYFCDRLDQHINILSVSVSYMPPWNCLNIDNENLRSTVSFKRLIKGSVNLICHHFYIIHSPGIIMLLMSGNEDVYQCSALMSYSCICFYVFLVYILLSFCSALRPSDLIWTVMLVWRKGNINRTVSVP